MDVCAAVAVYRKVSSTAAAPRIVYAPSHRTTAISNAVSAHSHRGVAYGNAWAARANLTQARFSCYAAAAASSEEPSDARGPRSDALSHWAWTRSLHPPPGNRRACKLRSGGHTRPFISPDVVLVLHIRKPCSSLPPSLSHTNSNPHAAMNRPVADSRFEDLPCFPRSMRSGPWFRSSGFRCTSLWPFSDAVHDPVQSADAAAAAPLVMAIASPLRSRGMS